MEKTDTNIIYEWLSEVKDPEVPVLSVTDLGIIRAVAWEEDKLIISITPTYNGCPAMDVISMEIRLLCLEKGIRNLEIRRKLSPAWTTDWITPAGKQQLEAYGIAPPLPVQQVCTPTAFAAEEAIPCPRCKSLHTKLISRFGSTACKALYQCSSCLEPFDYFKCH